MLRVHDEVGTPLAATFELGIVDGSISLLFNSAGGKPSKKGGVARNADYAEGLKLILRRLGQLGATITDAYVDSRRMQEEPLAVRRLGIPGRPYGIELETIADFDSFRKKLTGAQRLIGKVDKTKGGNERKRIRMQLCVPGFPPNADSIARLGLILSESPGVPDPDGPSSVPPSKPKKFGGSSGGQGFITETAKKLVIEAAAMAAAEKHYRKHGWKVTDVSLRKIGYDLLCELGDRRRCVEVKGTTQPPKSVFVSGHEVSFALAHPLESVLFVLSDIVITMEGDVPLATGGVTTLFEPWGLEFDRLTPTTYSYALDG